MGHSECSHFPPSSMILDLRMLPISPSSFPFSHAMTAYTNEFKSVTYSFVHWLMDICGFASDLHAVTDKHGNEWPRTYAILHVHKVYPQGNRRSSQSRDIQYFNGHCKRFLMGQQRVKTPIALTSLLGVTQPWRQCFFLDPSCAFLTSHPSPQNLLRCQTLATPAPGVTLPALPEPLQAGDWLACLLQRGPACL